MKNLVLLAACAAALALGAPARAAIVDINGASSAGTTLSLAAGTYNLAFAGVAGGGLYDAWNAWGSVGGCDQNGAHCGNGWLDFFEIDFGGGHADVYNNVPTDYIAYQTPALALAAFQAGPLYVSHDGAAYQPVSGPMQFTLASAQDVRFLVPDAPYGDNLGGVSLSLTAAQTGGAPEPSAWALMIAGFGGLGLMLRRRPVATA